MDPIIEQEIDLRAYLRVLIKRRWTIITFFTVVVLTTIIYSFTATPIFQATACIIIEKENPNLVSIQEVMAVDSTGSDYYQTQYKIIESRAVARKVIQRMDLENSPEFFSKPKDGFLSNIKNWFASIKDQGASLLKSDMSDIENDSELVSNFISRIEIEPIRNSRLVDVSIKAKDPVLAARMANELARSYMDQNMEVKLLAAKDAVQWLNDRINEERKKVEGAENKLLTYKEQHGIITDFSSDSENITAQKLASLNTRVIEAESQRVEAETRYRQAVEVENSAEMLDSIPKVLSNPLIQEIKKMEVNIYNRMSEFSKKYGMNHPQMIALQSELDDLKKRKINEAKRVINALRNEYKLSVAKEKSLKKAFNRQKQESLTMNKKAVRFGVLQRQAESSRHMYELLIKRFKETSLTEEMRTGNIRIVDKAEVPKNPIKPEKKLNVLLSIVLGLTLGVGLAFFIEYLDNTIKLPDEIKDYLKIPYLGPVPAYAVEETRDKDTVFKNLVTIHSPKSTASESFRGIRTGILFSSAGSAPQVILIASSAPSEGKTSTATNLSVTMAKAGSRVLLIDCDLRRPRVHKFFNLSRDVGISNVLVGSCELKDAIIPSGIDNLDIIPCGPIPPNPSEVLGSETMRDIIKTLRKDYTRIIIDSPPISAVTDAVVLASIADGVVMIVRSGDTPRQIVKNGLSQLQALEGAHILGAVLNGVETGRDSYYYYQYYYYYYGEDDGKKKKTVHRKKRNKSSKS